jgi:hypothetical protein
MGQQRVAANDVPSGAHAHDGRNRDPSMITLPSKFQQRKIDPISTSKETTEAVHERRGVHWRA